MRQSLIIFVLAVAGVLAYLGYDHWYRDDGEAVARSIPPAVVAVTAATEETWQPTIKATGSLRAIQGVSVTAQEAGQITAIHFESGRQVQRGDLLVQQYVEDEEVRLKGLKSELVLARKSYDRSQSLINTQAVSQSQLDSTLSDLERMTALVQNLEVSIAKRTIRAPFDGVLGIRRVDVGQYIEPGDEIVTLEALDPIFVEFSLPQGRLPEVFIGQTVSIDVDAYPGEIFAAVINAIEPQIDPATRSFQVQARIDNAELKLRPGMFVNSHLLLPARNRIVTIPQAAISYNPYGNSVFVVDQEQGARSAVARSAYVTLGEKRGDQVAVLSGVIAGELVVTAGQLRLRNGTPVTIDERTVVGNDPEPTVEDS